MQRVLPMAWLWLGRQPPHRGTAGSLLPRQAVVDSHGQPATAATAAAAGADDLLEFFIAPSLLLQQYPDGQFINIARVVCSSRMLWM